MVKGLRSCQDCGTWIFGKFGRCVSCDRRIELPQRVEEAQRLGDQVVAEDRAERYLDGIDLCMRIESEFERFAHSPEINREIVRARLNRSRFFVKLERYDEAVALADQIASGYCEDNDGQIRELEASAAVVVSGVGMWSGDVDLGVRAKEAYAQALLGDPLPEVRERGVLLIVGAGRSLMEAGRGIEAIRILGEAVGQADSQATDRTQVYIDEAYSYTADLVLQLAGLDRPRWLVGYSGPTDLWSIVSYSDLSGLDGVAAENLGLFDGILEAMLTREKAQKWPRDPRRVAASPYWSLPRLTSLARHDDPAIRAGVAENPRTSEDLLSDLARDPVDDVRMGVAKNPSTPTVLLNSLAEDPVLDVRYMRAWNDNAPAGVQEFRRTSVGLAWAAEKGVVDSEVLREIAEDAASNTPDIREALRILQAWLVSNELEIGASPSLVWYHGDLVDSVGLYATRAYEWTKSSSTPILRELIRDPSVCKFPLAPAIILRECPVTADEVNEILAEAVLPNRTPPLLEQLVSIACLRPEADCDLVRRAADAFGYEDFWRYVMACLCAAREFPVCPEFNLSCIEEDWYGAVWNYHQFEVGSSQFATVAEVFLQQYGDQVTDEALVGVVVADGKVHIDYEVDGVVLADLDERRVPVDVMIAMLGRPDLPEDLRAGMMAALRLTG